MNYIAECLEKFQSLNKVLKEDLGSGKAYLALKSLEKEFSLSLSFVLILIAIGELEEEDLPEYLQTKFKLQAEKAQTLSGRLFSEVYEPALDRQFEVLGGNEIDKNPLRYKAFDISSVFEGNLINFLKLPPAEVRDFNIYVFAAIDADPLLEDRLINSLYANKEIISRANILHDGRELKPTVSNWIKDFVADGGGGLFDGLVLAKYLSSSPNAGKLDESEKMLLSKILKTYRNLVFFPESMEHVPMELWEVLPVENDNGIRDVLAEDDSPNLSMPVTRINSEPEKKVETAVSEAEDSQMSKLQAALSDYAPTSLEYKVIKQELDRLRQLTNQRN